MKDKPGIDKKTFFEQRLATGSAFLHLDARSPGVLVPAAFAGEAHLVLQYGYSLAIPIPDLRVTEWGVRATLSFSRTPFETAVPWPAVFGVHGDDGQSLVWYEDMPEDLRRSAKSQQPGPVEAKETAERAPVAGKRRGHLKLVD